MAMTTYGIVLRSQARELLMTSNAGNFEENSKTAANLLSRAAGVFQHVSQQQLSKWTVKPDVPLPEATDETLLALSELCLAEAQQITIKKGVLKAMTPAVLSKLCMDVHLKYHHILQLLKGMGATSELVLPAFISYASANAVLWKAVAYKLMALDHYSKGGYGLAVAYAEAAAKLLSEERKDTNLLDAQFWKEYQAERTAVTFLTATYKQENETIYYEVVPPSVEAPEAKSLSKPAPFDPPQPIQVEIAQTQDSGCCVQ